MSTKPPDFPPLAPECLLVFLARDRCLRGPWLAGWEAWLTPEEWAHAERFLCRAARRDYLLGKAMTRRVIAHYAGIAPGALRFVTNPYGKPAVQGAAVGLPFSLSHCAGHAALALARGLGHVGVDLEAPQASAVDWALSRSCFDPRETAALEALPQGERAAGFLRLWVLKEAFVKAVGLGLSLPLDSFAFLPGPGGAYRLHPPAAGPWSRQRWDYGTFRFADCHGGWVVGAGRDGRRVEFIDWAAGESGGDDPAR